MPLGDPTQTGAVFGNGPFVEVGTPTAAAVSGELIVVGGDLGFPQWNGRSPTSRSDRSVGWYPVATYDPSDLTCRSFFTSNWEINALAIHPSGELVAVGTGSYDGGYLFEGQLLLHNPINGSTVSMLSTERCVEAVEWLDSETLTFTVAPVDEEDIDDWSNLIYESFTVCLPDWQHVDRRSVDLAAWPAQSVPAIERDLDGPRNAVAELSASHGKTWVVRRQSWAIATADDRIVLGLDGALECWSPGFGNPTWRTELDGTCTQLVVRSADTMTVGVWENPAAAFLARPLSVQALNTRTAEMRDLFRPEFPAVLVSRSDGHLIIRDTASGPSTGNAMKVLSPSGEVLAELDAGAYDLFNHFFDIGRAKDFLILTGQNPKSYQDKWVATVERSWTGRWAIKRLFPLAWTAGAHLFGGPGLWVDDSNGSAIVHAGAVHDGRGLLKGNAFVVRRKYPSGEVDWHVPLDNEVTAIDESNGEIIAVTNVGELLAINGQTGQIRLSQTITVDDHPVVPLSLAISSDGRIWIGTLDGRAVELVLPARPHGVVANGLR